MSGLGTGLGIGLIGADADIKASSLRPPAGGAGAVWAEFTKDTAQAHTAFAWTTVKWEVATLDDEGWQDVDEIGFTIPGDGLITLELYGRQTGGSGSSRNRWIMLDADDGDSQIGDTYLTHRNSRTEWAMNCTMTHAFTGGLHFKLDYYSHHTSTIDGTGLHRVRMLLVSS
jgi:hypothetical protein